MTSAPTRLERYELLDRIAVGGMAEVFRARASGAHGFEKTLAIKRILPDLARDPEFEQRFINEAKLAVKLSHANVVQVFDFGRFSGSLFIAMEYVEGLDLAALLKAQRSRGEPVPIASALYIAIEMARGLDFAHQRSVIHRDVSPSNILLSRAGEVKIADFGIAEAVAKRRRDRRSSGRIMGKWRYMSPEQTRAEPLTIASDVFAAAAVMYEVFTNEKLFPGDEAEQIIENIHSMEVPPASSKRTGLPVRVDEILGRALAREASERPTAAEILRELLDTSYESTIVASALGVSDAVDSVLGAKKAESGDQVGLDDLIRAQLVDSEGRAPTIRKTDIGGIPESTQTAQAIVKRGVDADGITILEVDDTLAANPVAMRGERRKTAPPEFEESVDAAPGDAGGESSDAVGAVTTTEPPTRPALPWLMAASLVVLLAAGGAWFFARERSQSTPEKLPVAVADAATTIAAASVRFESQPPGAELRINDALFEKRTPVTVSLDPTVPYRFDLRLSGYRIWEREEKLRPGENIRFSPVLDRLRATLDVRTRPPGATVILDGKELGVTPFFDSKLAPGENRTLEIRKTDFKTITKTVTLVTGRPVLIVESLVSSIVYAEVNLSIIVTEHGGWADAFLGSKRVGRAPGKIRLPLGRQRLTLKNDKTGAVKRVVIDVKPGKAQVHRVSLAP